MRPMTEAGSIFLCPRFFDDARTRQKDAPCHVLDRGTLMIESMSMLDILSGRKYPTNRDGTPSGYREIMQWDGRKSFESAPTYAYFAQGKSHYNVTDNWRGGTLANQCAQLWPMNAYTRQDAPEEESLLFYDFFQFLSQK